MIKDQAQDGSNIDYEALLDQYDKQEEEKYTHLVGKKCNFLFLQRTAKEDSKDPNKIMRLYWGEVKAVRGSVIVLLPWGSRDFHMGRREVFGKTYKGENHTESKTEPKIIDLSSDRFQKMEVSK